MSRRHAVILFAVSALSTRTAHAADKACMEAASKGQEVRDHGHFVEAKALFQRCAASTCPAPIPTYCATWLAELTPKVPSVVVRVVDESDRDVHDATATIDGVPIVLDGRSLEIDPGRHRLRIEKAGSKPFETELLTAEAEKDRVVVGKLAREAPEPSRARSRVPLASWIGWGIGAAGLLSFGAFALKARSDFDDFQSTCGSHCANADRDSVSTSVTIADVSLVIGLVAAGVGTYFFLARPRAEVTSRARGLAW